jgi:hypothetical protein
MRIALDNYRQSRLGHLLLLAGLSAGPAVATTIQGEFIGELAGGHFKPVKTFAELPGQVRESFYQFTSAKSIAEPDQPFDSTDVLSNPPLPSRRFILGGEAPYFWFVAYEHGGRGLHRHLVGFFHLEANNTTTTIYSCSWTSDSEPVTMESLKWLVRSKNCTVTNPTREH